MSSHPLTLFYNVNCFQTETGKFLQTESIQARCKYVIESLGTFAFNSLLCNGFLGRPLTAALRPPSQAFSKPRSYVFSLRRIYGSRVTFGKGVCCVPDYIKFIYNSFLCFEKRWLKCVYCDIFMYIFWHGLLQVVLCPRLTMRCQHTTIPYRIGRRPGQQAPHLPPYTRTEVSSVLLMPHRRFEEETTSPSALGTQRH